MSKVFSPQSCYLDKSYQGQAFNIITPCNLVLQLHPCDDGSAPISIAHIWIDDLQAAGVKQKQPEAPKSLPNILTTWVASRLPQASFP